jgi:hypothetical protein
MVVAVFEVRRAKVILPKVPDVLKPQVPSFSECLLDFGPFLQILIIHPTTS